MKEYWNDGALQAIADRVPESEHAGTVLKKLGVPAEVPGPANSQWVLNPDEIAIASRMGVRPSFRRRNIGRNLLRFIIDFAHKELSRAVILNVITREPALESAIALYESERAVRIGIHGDSMGEKGFRMRMYAYPKHPESAHKKD